MYYLKKFENDADYLTYINGEDVLLPNVSYCASEVHVHYNPIVDPYNGHAYVDLGLPSGTKWATMNVGATTETDYGLYFQWGDTQGYTASQVGSGEGQKAFRWADYKWSDNGSSSVFTKYNAADGKMVLDIEDDAARVNWGGDWRMPTEAECQELIDNTNNEWITVNNVNGYKFTSKTDSSKYIFIPAAGMANNDEIGAVGSAGYVCSSSRSNSNVHIEQFLYFFNYAIIVNGNNRCNGFSVRGVVG